MDGNALHKLSIQLRCIRLNNGDGVFNHNLPQFGFYRVNQDKNVVYLKIGDPPNDKKRHDKILDVTTILQTGSKNVLEIMQINKQDRDPYRYVCGVFIVRNLNPQDFINYVKNYQCVIPFERGLDYIK